MAREDGYTKVACDRCGRNAFLQEGSAAAQSWYDISHLSATASTSAQTPTTYTLCSDCYSAFQTLASTVDATFQNWLSESKGGKQE